LAKSDGKEDPVELDSSLNLSAFFMTKQLRKFQAGKDNSF